MDEAPQQAVQPELARARQLTRRIKTARSAGELRLLHQHQGHSFNGIHVAAALVRLAHLSASSSGPPLAADLLDQALQLNHQMGPRELSSTLWAAAAAATVHSAPPAREWARRMAEAALPRIASSGSGRDVSMALWALARLGAHPGERCLSALLTRALSLQQQHHQHQHQQRLAQGGGLDAQALANLAWALATLRHRPPAGALRALRRALGAAHVQLSPQGHANALWALSRLSAAAAAPPGSQQQDEWAACGGPTWARHVSALLERQDAWGQPFKPTELSMLLFALARLQPAPVARGASGSGAAAVAGEEQAWVSAGALDAAVGYFAGGGGGAVAELSVSQACCLLWGLAHLHEHRQQQQQVAEGGSGVSLEPALLGPAGRALLDAFFAHTAPRLRAADGRTLAHTALALQRLSHLSRRRPLRQPPPPAWQEAFLQASARRLPDMDARAAATLAYALAQLGVRPGEAWLGAFFAATQRRRDGEEEEEEEGAADCMCALAALARWGAAPPAVWVHACVRRLEAGLRAQLGQGPGGRRAAARVGSRAVLALARLQLLPSEGVVEALRAALEMEEKEGAGGDCEEARRAWRSAVQLLPALEGMMAAQGEP